MPSRFPERGRRRYGPRIKTSRTFSVLALVITSALMASGCGDPATDSVTATTATPSAPEVSTRVLLAGVAPPGALLAERDGSLLVGDRLSGEIRRVTPDGVLLPDAVARVDTAAASDDQRGLLGLARTVDGRLFASWTRATDGRIVVGELTGETSSRVLWEGPVSAQLANGGRLVATPAGLVIGIGDLLGDPTLASDGGVPNRKILQLDPFGPPGQTPRILSTGWNNPFALAVSADGRVWVADNTGGNGPERLGRADRPADEAAALGGPGEGEAAPAGLVALDGTFARCGYLSGRVDRLILDGDGRATTSGVLAEPCRTAVVRLADGRLVMGADDGLVVTVTPVD